MDIDLSYESLSYEELIKLNKFYWDMSALLKQETSIRIIQEVHDLASDYVIKLFITKYKEEMGKDNG